MEMMSFAPEELFSGEPNWCPQKDTYTETRILPHYSIRTSLSRTQKWHFYMVKQADVFADYVRYFKMLKESNRKLKFLRRIGNINSLNLIEWNESFKLYFGRSPFWLNQDSNFKSLFISSTAFRSKHDHFSCVDRKRCISSKIIIIHLTCCLFSVCCMFNL